MKAVSLIVQFVLFFVIGLGFFLTAGNLFRYQSDLIKNEILASSSNLSVSSLSAASIRAVESCKSCDSVMLKFDQKPIAGYNPTFQLSNGIILKIEPEGKQVQSSMHSLSYSLSFGSGDVSSSKTINLTYDRTKNNLVIK